MSVNENQVAVKDTSCFECCYNNGKFTLLCQDWIYHNVTTSGDDETHEQQAESDPVCAARLSSFKLHNVTTVTVDILSVISEKNATGPGAFLV